MGLSLLRQPRPGTIEWEPTHEGQRAQSWRRIQNCDGAWKGLQGQRCVDGCAVIPNQYGPAPPCLVGLVIYENGQLLWA